MTSGPLHWLKRTPTVAIKFSCAAEADLRDIFLYGIETHGVAQAERYKRELDEAFQALLDHPKMARPRREITPPVRVFPVQKHMIIYTALEDRETVFILRVRRHRDNWTDRPIE